MSTPISSAPVTVAFVWFWSGLASFWFWPWLQTSPPSLPSGRHFSISPPGRDGLASSRRGVLCFTLPTPGRTDSREGTEHGRWTDPQNLVVLTAEVICRCIFFRTRIGWRTRPVTSVASGDLRSDEREIFLAPTSSCSCHAIPCCPGLPFTPPPTWACHAMGAQTSRLPGFTTSTADPLPGWLTTVASSFCSAVRSLLE